MGLIDQVQTVYELLDDNRPTKLGLFKIEDGRAVTPLLEDTLSLFGYRATLPDEFRSQELIRNLIKDIQAGKGYKGINHIGFCYKVASKGAEAKRLIDVAKSSNTPIYREPSNDDGDWLFVGDFSDDITNPVLEVIPHEGNTNDKWVDYWLPHIQFDIDTGISPDEIKTIVRRKYISDRFVPYSIQIDGITYIQRVRLGCVEGVNVYLDLATNNRNMNYRKSWARLA
jgi:hypothetical protein